MKASDAAQKAHGEGWSPEYVEKQIPVYSNPLPRRGWIARFLAALPTEDARNVYADLK